MIICLYEAFIQEAAINQQLYKNIVLTSSRNVCFGYCWNRHTEAILINVKYILWGDKIKTNPFLHTIMRRLRILYSSKFILTTTFLNKCCRGNNDSLNYYS